MVPADTTPPVLDLPADITVDATGPTGAAVSYTVGATDDTDPSPTVVCLPASGSTFPVGTTQVDCTATDDAGNTATGSFAVTVEPVTAGLSVEKSVDVAQVNLDPIAEDPDPTQSHRLDVTKIETHLSLPPATTNSATATCPEGYLATDGSLRLDAIDQGTGTYADAVVLAGGVTTDGQGWTGTVPNNTTGQVQAKVNLVCVSRQTTSGEDHHHALITSEQITSTHTWGPGTWDAGLVCGEGRVAIAPSYRFTSGQGVVPGSWRAGDGFRFTVEVPQAAQVVLGITCLSRSLHVTAGHTHDLVLTELTDEFTVPGGEVVEHSLTCPVGAKGITAANRADPGLVFLGSDSQPLTRVFEFANLNPTSAPLTAHVGLLCLDVGTGGENVVRDVTDTAWVSTSSPDTTTTDDTDSATFRASAAAGPVTVAATAHVVATSRGTAVKIRVATKISRQVRARLIAIGHVQGTHLDKGDVLARTSTRLHQGRSQLALTSLRAAARPLRRGIIDRARLVLTLRDGTHVTRVVLLRAP